MDSKQLKITFVLFATTLVAAAEECLKTSQCACETPSGTVVDLKLLQIPGPNAWFTAVDSVKGYTYYFSPCSALTQNDCHSLYSNVVVCQAAVSTASYYDAGDANTEVFAGDPAASTLTVTYNTSNPKRTSIFTLICSGETRLEFATENPTSTYNFNLYTPMICQPSKSSGLSGGSILLIIFFVFFLVYWIGGFIFMKFVRRAEGLETIPNYEFWKELPLLIRDGVVFTSRGCKGESTYEKI